MIIVTRFNSINEIRDNLKKPCRNDCGRNTCREDGLCIRCVDRARKENPKPVNQNREWSENKKLHYLNNRLKVVIKEPKKPRDESYSRMGAIRRLKAKWEKRNEKM